MIETRVGVSEDLAENTHDYPIRDIPNPDTISQEFIDYLNDYVDYCKSLHVHVYFTYAPYLNETWAWKEYWKEEDLERFDEVLTSKLHAPLITSLKDSLYPREYIWDFPRHLNTEGAKIRSERLAEALKPYLESEEPSSAH